MNKSIGIALVVIAGLILKFELWVNQFWSLYHDGTEFHLSRLFEYEE
jgi:hypothetical protein